MLSEQLGKISKNIEAAGDLDDSFEYEEYKDFIKEYGLEDDIDMFEEDIGGEVIEWAKLKPAVVKELKQVIENFDQDWYGKLQEIGKAVVKEVEEEVMGIHPDFDIQYDIDQNRGLEYTAISISMSLHGASIEYSPANLYYHDTGDHLYDSAKSWSWLAWLGLYDSPLEDEGFLKSWEESETISYFENVDWWTSEGIEEDAREMVSDLESNK